MRDSSSAPYYVDKYLCDGKHCRYTAIRVDEITGIDTNVWSIVVTDSNGKTILTVTNEDMPSPPPENNAAAAQAIYDAMSIANGADPLFVGTNIIGGLDILCVTNESSRGIIYARHGYTMTLEGIGNMSYVLDMGDLPDIYMLCRSVSLIFGACRSSDSDAKQSNIFSGVKIDIDEGETIITWPTGSIPLIMGNCKLCDYCISYCPRKAIKNKINDKPISMRGLSLDPDSGDDNQLYRQYYLNSRTVDGTEIYT